jgi:hypothetical protein
MDVDEDYDDEPDEEKKAGAAVKGSPNGNSTESANGNGVASNGRQGTPSKIESSA